MRIKSLSIIRVEEVDCQPEGFLKAMDHDLDTFVAQDQAYFDSLIPKFFEEDTTDDAFIVVKEWFEFSAAGSLDFQDEGAIGRLVTVGIRALRIERQHDLTMALLGRKLGSSHESEGEIADNKQPRCDRDDAHGIFPT
jgi:hypothetical protein